MRKVLLQIVSILPLINCWKPIVSHQASYSVEHSYPSIGSEPEIAKKSSNELYSHDTSLDHLFESFNTKTNDFTAESPVSALRVNDGRFLSAKALQFHTNSFNGIYYDVSKMLLLVMLSKFFSANIARGKCSSCHLLFLMLLSIHLTHYHSQCALKAFFVILLFIRKTKTLFLPVNFHYMT